MISLRTFAVGLALCLAVAAPAEASPTVEECVAAVDRGQEARDEGRLREARRRFATCGNLTCPPVMRTDCLQWLSEVEKLTPTVLILVQNERGDDILTFDLEVDGAREEVRAGRALPLDPGNHRIVVRARGYQDKSVDVTAREGEVRRPIAVRLAPLLGKPDETQAEAGPPLATWVLAGVSAGLFITGGVVFLKTSSDLADLRDRCAGRCSPEVLDAPRSQGTLADVLVIAGGLTLVAAAAFWLFKPSSAARSAASR